MQELLRYLRSNGYKTFIVTGGGQDFVRVHSESTHGIPPERVAGTALGNSTGDRQMLEYTKAGGGARLSMLVLHDDAKREHSCGPAQGLGATEVGVFPRGLHDQAGKQGWVVISMKRDWKKIFAWEP